MHNIDISTDDCKTIVAGLKALKLAIDFSNQEIVPDMAQEIRDDIQRIIDGFTELTEYGGR